MVAGSKKEGCAFASVS